MRRSTISSSYFYSLLPTMLNLGRYPIEPSMHAPDEITPPRETKADRCRRVVAQLAGLGG
eukprot:1190627-Prorocentrum_minimum.AAC.2